MTNILVAGGAGYIGAHACLDLFNKGFMPIVYVNLSNGHAEFVKWGRLEIGDIRDRNKLDEVLRVRLKNHG
jgi:UDP-glucose 4-epimerase